VVVAVADAPVEVAVRAELKLSPVVEIGARALDVAYSPSA
jgi:hypothetical protein